MSKNFQSFLKTSQDQKIVSNISEENKRLRDTISRLTIAKEELEHALNVEGNEIKLDEIKLISNIRSKDNYQIEDLMNSIKEHGQLQPVLITADNYLIAGHRRFHAIKALKKEKILVSKLDKEYKEVQNAIEIWQFEENEQRKNLDNFEISDVFQSYKNRGFSQSEIGRLFNKKRQWVYALVTIQNLDQELKSFLLEFQIYAWSKEKYKEVKKVLNEQGKEIKEDPFYLKNKGFIGWKTLYAIAKLELQEQRSKFLHVYKDRFTEKELKTYFSDLINKSNISNEFENKIKKVSKEIEKFEKILFDMPEELEPEKKDKILKAIELLQDASKILS